MTRGTTPTLFYDLGVDSDLIKYAELTINQNEKNVIIKKLRQSAGRYYITLTEKETLSLKPGTCKTQIKMKFKDGNVATTNIETVVVNDVLNDGVMV